MFNNVLGLGLLIVLSCSSCASIRNATNRGAVPRQEFEARLQKRVGQDINEVVQEIGAPKSTFPMPNGTTIYTWENGSTSYMTAYNPGIGMAATSENRKFCSVSYIVGQKSKIESWQYRGNECF
jgi:hypothetical protein